MSAVHTIHQIEVVALVIELIALPIAWWRHLTKPPKCSGLEEAARADILLLHYEVAAKDTNSPWLRRHLNLTRGRRLFGKQQEAILAIRSQRRGKEFKAKLKAVRIRFLGAEREASLRERDERRQKELEDLVCDATGERYIDPEKAGTSPSAIELWLHAESMLVSAMISRKTASGPAARKEAELSMELALRSLEIAKNMPAEEDA